jgi:hypothetical protein
MTPAADSPDAARGEGGSQSPRTRALLASAQRLHDVVQPDTPPMIFPLEPEAEAT